MLLKPGYKTTELLVTVLTAVGSVLAAWNGSLSPKYAAIASAVSVAAYSLARAITKYGVATSGKPIVTVPAVPAPPPAAPGPQAV